jgi:hypothetical protein
MQQKQGIKPSNQKVNPKGKYNDKRWVKLGRREILDIDQVNRALYNDMSISNIYASTDNMYIRTKPPKPGAGRIGNKKNNEQEQ